MAVRCRYSQVFDVVIVLAAGMELVRRKAKAWFSENKGLSTELDIRRAVARGRQGSSRSFTRTRAGSLLPFLAATRTPVPRFSVTPCFYNRQKLPAPSRWASSRPPSRSLVGLALRAQVVRAERNDDCDPAQKVPDDQVALLRRCPAVGNGCAHLP